MAQKKGKTVQASVFDADDARRRTEQIRDLAAQIEENQDQLCWLVWQAKTGRIWLAMDPPLRGFRSWVLDHLAPRIRSEVHGYRLYHQAEWTRQLEEAAGLKRDGWQEGQHVRITERWLRLLHLRKKFDDVVKDVATTTQQKRGDRLEDAERESIILTVVEAHYREAKAEAKRNRAEAAADVPGQVAASLDDILALIPQVDGRTWRGRELAAKVRAVRAALNGVLSERAA